MIALAVAYLCLFAVVAFFAAGDEPAESVRGAIVLALLLFVGVLLSLATVFA